MPAKTIVDPYFRAFNEHNPDARYRLLRTIVNRSGLMACEWRFSGTNTGPLGDLPATNRAVEVSGASLLQFKNGKIAWLHGYHDRRSLLRQLAK